MYNYKMNYRRDTINKRALIQALKQTDGFMLIGLLNLVDVQTKKEVKVYEV